AIESKKGEDVVILEMDRSSGAFTDYFIVCSGTNPRQIQAIADDVQKQLADDGQRPNSVEGYNQAEWVLLDYVDFVLHVFSERAPKFYYLDGRGKSPHPRPAADREKKPAKKKAKKAPAKKAARPKPTPAARSKSHIQTNKKKSRKSA